MLKELAARIGAAFARLTRREPLAPGRFESDSKTSFRGWLHAAPWVWPSREYLLYLPRGGASWKRRALVVMIHGCRQTPEEFAAATRIAALADERGWLVLLPRQTDKANAWSCWNWFDDATSAGRGEAAIVAAQVRAVRRRYRVHPGRIFVAGFSAGGALAAALALRHPRLFAGVFVHSGLACGAASGAAQAVSAMRGGASVDPARIAGPARARAGAAVRLPLVVVHGDRDSVVAEINAGQVARQFLALNGYPLEGASGAELPAPDTRSSETLPWGRTVVTSEYRSGRRLVVRMVRVAGLDHAWSGGDPSLPFSDAGPPDATRLLAELVR